MMSPETRLTRVCQCLATCLLLQIAITYPLWFGIRSYPLLPLLDIPLPDSLVYLPTVISSLLCLGLLLLLLGRQRNWTFLLFLFSALLAASLDVSKLQIWFYFQFILLSILYLKNRKPAPQILKYLQLLFPFIYFWGAIHKINGYYFDETFPWFMETFEWTKNFGDNIYLIVLSILLELIIALGLWWRPGRYYALFLGLLFHLSILFFLGPFGQNWNEVVWPWNLAMIGLLLLLYSKRRPLKRYSFKPILLPFLLLGILPFFSNFQLWPGILSFKMYTGDQTEGVLYSYQARVANLSEQANQQIHCIAFDTLNSPNCFLIIDDWAFAEIGVAPFNTPRRLRQLARHFCTCVENPQSAGLKILEVEKWKQENPWRDIPCHKILNLNKKAK